MRVMLLLLLAGTVFAQDDVKDIPSEEVKIGGRETERYFRIGPKPNTRAPRRGYGLILILPGGNGGAGFNTFCRRIYKFACDESCVAAQLVAVKWTPDQRVVWPTRASRVEKMEFGTERFVEDVVRDVRKWKKIDPTRIFVLAWSSSGPAAYTISLQPRKSPTGFLIAMSVFKSRDVKEAKGEAYYLYHSPTDPKCPFRSAEEAKTRLTEAGARVELATFEGGHRWVGDVYGNLRKGFRWLEKNHAPPSRSRRS